MSLKVYEVIKVIEEFAPSRLAEPWDNCGLLVGDMQQEVDKILVALDPTVDIVNYAIENNVDMIITHHPIMMDKINKVTSSTIEGQKIINLLKNNISLFAAHTNLDRTIGGINDTFARQIGLSQVEILDIDNLHNLFSYVRVGLLETPLTLKEYAIKIKDILNLSYIHTVGDNNKIIKKVAIVCGSGTSQLEKAISVGADVFVTGDVKYHVAQYAKEIGICLIDATHFGTENIVVKLLGQVLNEKIEGVEIILDNQLQNPIQIIK